ncbi:NmrA family NAD(P)-binding protein [Nonomuraea antimicrobica]
MRTTAELEERLARPSAGLVDDLSRLDGDILILGAGGKLGPSLVRLALRATGAAGRERRIIAVSRFSEPGLAETLAAEGATVVPADVADERALRDLPDAANVVFLVGAKFGTQGASTPPGSPTPTCPAGSPTGSGTAGSPPCPPGTSTRSSPSPAAAAPRTRPWAPWATTR